MKLARQLICEVLNTNAIIFQLKKPTEINEVDRYYLMSNSTGKTVGVIAMKGTNYRPIMITSKVSFNYDYTMMKLFQKSGDIFGDNCKVDFLIKGGYQVTIYNALIAQNGGDSASEHVKKRIEELSVYKIKKDSGWMEAKDFYVWLVKESVNQPIIDHYFPELKTLSSAETSFKHKDIEIVGYDEKKHKELLKVIEESEKLFKKSGIKSMVYGKVFLVAKRGQNNSSVMADYTQASDTMRVFDLGLIKFKDTMVHSFIHELGHRYYYKVLSPASQRLVLEKYYEKVSNFKKNISANIDAMSDSLGLKPYKEGDIVTDETYGDVVYFGTDYSGLRKMGKRFYKFIILDKEKKPTSKFLKFDSMAHAILYFNKNTTVSSAKKLDDWLPSTYSMTTDKEWFAEVFSNAIESNNKEILEWIKNLK